MTKLGAIPPVKFLTFYFYPYFWAGPFFPDVAVRTKKWALWAGPLLGPNDPFFWAGPLLGPLAGPKVLELCYCAY